MIDQDQLFSLLREANPVPDPDHLLGQVTGSKPSTERTPAMPATLAPSTRPVTERRSRPPLRLAGVLTAIIAVVAITIGAVLIGRTPSPGAVAESFFITLTAGDEQDFLRLFDDDAQLFGVGSLSDVSAREYLEDYFDFRAVTESTFEFECDDPTETQTGGRHTISCVYVWENAVTRGLGVPGTEGRLVMVVDDGGIVHLVSDGFDLSNMDWPFPTDYLMANTPPAEFAAACDPANLYLALGEECGRLTMQHLDGMIEAWKERPQP